MFAEPIGTYQLLDFAKTILNPIKVYLSQFLPPL
jgi:hypothetical protein